MSVFITSIAELSQNFFHSDPLKFDKYFAITPTYQKYCLDANLPTRFTITLAKEAMLIHDIAIHLLIGGVKLTTGAVKGICAVASGILGLETDHQTPSKQAAVHIGFACVYAADILSSIASINKTYPQHLIDKIKNIFAEFLEVPNKKITIQYVADPEIEEALKKKQAEAEEKEQALQKEQRKTKEQEELLKKTQQELDNIHDSEFLLEEELENISKEARQAPDTEIYKENYIEKEPPAITISFISANKLRTDPFQYKLTYDSESESDDEDFWFDDRLITDEITEKEKEDGLCNNNISSSVKKTLKEEKESIEKFPPEKKSVIPKKVTSQEFTRNLKKKTSSNNNPPQTSNFALRKAYDNRMRSRSKKTLVS